VRRPGHQPPLLGRRRGHHGAHRGQDRTRDRGGNELHRHGAGAGRPRLRTGGGRQRRRKVHHVVQRPKGA